MHVPLRCPSLSTINNHLPGGEAACSDHLRPCGWRQSSTVSCKCGSNDRVTRYALESDVNCFPEMSPYGAQKRGVAERRVFVKTDKRAQSVVSLKNRSE